MAETQAKPGGAALAEALPAETGATGSGGPGGGSVGAPSVAADLEKQIAGGAGGGSGEPKRGRGRPPIHGRYSKAGPVGGGDPLAADPAAVGGESGGGADPGQIDSGGVAAIPPELKQEIYAESLAFLQGLGESKLRDLALRCGLTEDEIKPHLEAAALSEKRRELICRLLPMVLDEWGVNPNFSPTGALLLVAGGPLVRFGMALKTLSDLAAERVELLKQQAKENAAKT